MVMPDRGFNRRVAAGASAVVAARAAARAGISGRSLLRPALSGQRNEFRPILEMHAVDVEPLGAPDETVALEDLADGARHAVAPRELAARAFEELPIIRLLVVDVDRGR